MNEMETIEVRAKAYAEARSRLADVVKKAEADIAAVRKRALPGIRGKVLAAAMAKGQLQSAIEDSEALFKKPKSRILHGIRVGFAKRKGKVTFKNPAGVVKLIRRHFSDQFDTLVKVTETPIKDALSRLSGADLKKIGATVSEADDEVLIKPADSEIDKIVDALLGAADDEGGAS